MLAEITLHMYIFIIYLLLINKKTKQNAFSNCEKKKRNTEKENGKEKENEKTEKEKETVNKVSIDITEKRLFPEKEN